jgi:predicted transcriptional regulator
MRHNTQVVVRMPKDLAQRLDRLVPALVEGTPLAAAGRVTRSTVARLALARGLDVLEASLAADAGEVTP